ncbi:uncharacterized protein MONBRDRAFT_8686 [Monosiga brevicollis MX1]|uniref:Uncharacterized protein n=1 Tax=Monosiga brevicollis TaxID=81824 RepID=A9V0T7_MONBE|nr:uncharacterized protein MONBRDRAFT_8686 [Monosiga brevicollis MX1]EDQ88692.1 predicted protein [Monosiga brevicollis MX1]|eukprot:XP_001746305.1 hypothetical protein [Monosiga brevicollis MX1]
MPSPQPASGTSEPGGKTRGLAANKRSDVSLSAAHHGGVSTRHISLILLHLHTATAFEYTVFGGIIIRSSSAQTAARITSSIASACFPVSSAFLLLVRFLRAALS